METQHFFLSPVKVIEFGRVIHQMSQALVSRHGIFRAFAESPINYERFLSGQVLTLQIDETICLGRMVRVRGANDSYYNIKLIHINGQTEYYLCGKLRRFGIISFQKRRYPRHRVAEGKGKIEVPAQIEFFNIVGTKKSNVIDYSLCGLHSEFFCGGQSLGEYVGQVLPIEIHTSHGKIIKGVTGKIMRIYDEMLSPGKMVRGLGVKFVRFAYASRSSYLSIVAQTECSKNTAGTVQSRVGV